MFVCNHQGGQSVAQLLSAWLALFDVTVAAVLVRFSDCVLPRWDCKMTTDWPPMTHSPNIANLEFVFGCWSPNSNLQCDSLGSGSKMGTCWISLHQVLSIRFLRHSVPFIDMIFKNLHCPYSSSSPRCWLLWKAYYLAPQGEGSNEQTDVF
jgi:hypothetical protein